MSGSVLAWSRKDTTCCHASKITIKNALHRNPTRVRPTAEVKESSWQTSARSLMVLQSSFASVLLMVGATLAFACKHPVAVRQPSALLMPQELLIDMKDMTSCAITLDTMARPAHL